MAPTLDDPDNPIRHQLRRRRATAAHRAPRLERPSARADDHRRLRRDQPRRSRRDAGAAPRRGARTLGRDRKRPAPSPRPHLPRRQQSGARSQRDALLRRATLPGDFPVRATQAHPPPATRLSPAKIFPPHPTLQDHGDPLVHARLPSTVKLHRPAGHAQHDCRPVRPALERCRRRAATDPTTRLRAGFATHTTARRAHSLRARACAAYRLTPG